MAAHLRPTPAAAGDRWPSHGWPTSPSFLSFFPFLCFSFFLSFFPFLPFSFLFFSKFFPSNLRLSLSHHCVSHSFPASLSHLSVSLFLLYLIARRGSPLAFNRFLNATFAFLYQRDAKLMLASAFFSCHNLNAGLEPCVCGLYATRISRLRLRRLHSLSFFILNAFTH